MAIYREPEHCLNCGKELEVIHKDMGKDFIGDTFMGYKSCDCTSPPPLQGEQEMEEAAIEYSQKIIPIVEIKNDRLIITREAVREDVYDSFIAGAKWAKGVDTQQTKKQ